MKKILLEINPKIENSDIGMITCFEKPFGISLSKYGEDVISIFYLYLKLFRTYNIKEVSKKNFFEKIKYILKFKLNIELKIIQVNNRNMHEIVQGELLLNNFVLIPGNLKELFYSIHYKKSNWDHLFLVNGFDDELKIYNTIDGVQLKTGDRYDEFIIEFDVLKKIFDAYLSEKLIMSVENKKYEKNIIFHKLYLDVLNTFLNNGEIQQYKEIEYINKIKVSNENKQEIIKELAKVINFKDYFYELLTTYYFKLYKIHDVELINKLRQEGIELIQTWKEVLTKITYSVARKKNVDIDNDLCMVFKLEDNIKETVFKLLKNIEKLEEKVKTTDIYFENNQDSIISVFNDAIKFNFNSEKNYNSWINDESPKIFFKNFKRNNNFNIVTELFFERNLEAKYFHAGIVFKTQNNELYFWGNYCNNTLRLEKIGEDSNYQEIKIPNHINKINLEITNDNNFYIFKYSFNNDKPRIIEYDLTAENIFEVGVGCKTWRDTGDLRLSFSNTILTNLE